MKLKKFLKIIKTICNDENCNEHCPFIVKRFNKKGEGYNTCLLDIAEIDEWDVKTILKAAKKAEAMLK